jgi:WD40 repeat protein
MTGAVVSPEGKRLAFRPNGQLALWDLSSQEARDQPVIVPGFEGETIAFSPDGTTLATYRDAKEGTVITLWDVATLMLSGRGREEHPTPDDSRRK